MKPLKKLKHWQASAQSTSTFARYLTFYHLEIYDLFVKGGWISKMASLSVFLPFLSEAGVGGLYHGGYCEEDGESKDDPVNILQYYQFSSIVSPI